MKPIAMMMCVTLFVLSNPVIAAEKALPVAMVKADTLIQNLNPVLSEVKQKATTALFFPTDIPSNPNSKLYASTSPNLPTSEVDYFINIDATAECKGAHYCNVGEIIANPGAKPQRMRDRNKKEITVPVSLAEQIRGYFTPGHAMADYFPPSMQWQYKNVLYTLTWNTPANLKLTEEQEKDMLVAIVNSAINEGPR